MKQDWQDLYDFPISWDWYRHYSVYESGFDPGPNEPEKAQETIVYQTTRPDAFQELSARFNHLQNNCNQVLDVIKKSSIYKGDYKGVSQKDVGKPWDV